MLSKLVNWSGYTSIFGGVLFGVAEGIAFPNGIAVTPDNVTLIVAESHGNKLMAFDIAACGILTNQLLFCWKSKGFIVL